MEWVAVWVLIGVLLAEASSWAHKKKNGERLGNAPWVAVLILWPGYVVIIFFVIAFRAMKGT
jgi:hypothetical protein